MLHALPLIRFRLSQRADLSRDLSNKLLVMAQDGNLGLPINFKADSGWWIDLDRMAVAEGKRQLVAALCGTITNTVDF